MSVCLTPFYVDDPKILGNKLPVPCGKCPPCFARRTSHWSFRLRVEGRKHLVSSFVTLTYEKTPKSKNGFSTLDKTDVQKYIKRLRKINLKHYGIESKVVYYVAGEYGSLYHRPHYHLIIFNACPNAIRSAWSLDGKPLGFVHIGNVSGASIGYTLKYISKKLINKKWHSRDDRKKEFQLCSKGIGLSYLENPDTVKWHKDAPAERCFTMIEDGKKISLPRYFRDKLFTESEKKQIAEKMSEIAIEAEYNLWLEHGDNLEEWKTKNTIEQIEKFNHKIKSNIDSL